MVLTGSQATTIKTNLEANIEFAYVSQEIVPTSNAQNWCESRGQCYRKNFDLYVKCASQLPISHPLNPGGAPFITRLSICDCTKRGMNLNFSILHMYVCYANCNS